jgi:TRAP-type C4-dicarboxylate transport system permease small subunit
MTKDQPLHNLFDRLLVPTLSYLAATVLFCLMLVTCVDVLGRYFNYPLFGGFELTEMLLATLIFAGLPLVTLRNDHVTVDLLDAVTPDWLLRIQHVVACAVGMAFTGFLSWRLWLRGDHMAAAGETTAQLKIQLAWLTYSMSVLMALTALALLVLAFRQPQRGSTAEL